MNMDRLSMEDKTQRGGYKTKHSREGAHLQNRFKTSLLRHKCFSRAHQYQVCESYKAILRRWLWRLHIYANGFCRGNVNGQY